MSQSLIRLNKEKLSEENIRNLEFVYCPIQEELWILLKLDYEYKEIIRWPQLLINKEVEVYFTVCIKTFVEAYLEQAEEPTFFLRSYNTAKYYHQKQITLSDIERCLSFGFKTSKAIYLCKFPPDHNFKLLWTDNSNFVKEIKLLRNFLGGEERNLSILLTSKYQVIREKAKEIYGKEDVCR